VEFKKGDIGRELEESIKENRGLLKESKLQVKELTDKCNMAKKNIDAVKSDLDHKQDERR
jgi:hypothetical protein